MDAGTAISSTSLVYRLAMDHFPALRRRAISSEAILQARERWQPEFRKEIHTCWQEHLRRDANIVDVRRLREYDTGKVKRKGPSAFFRCDLVQCSSDEAEFVLDLFYIKRTDAGWILAEHNEVGRVIVYKLGYIRYEHLVSVSWHGDKSTNLPVIFCRFWGGRGTPFSRFAYCVEGGDPRFPPSYFDIIRYSPSKRLTREQAVSRWPKLPDGMY